MKLFECGIRYEKTMGNGMQKKVTELYIVDALSFTEAERRIISEMGAFISGEFEVVSEKITKYSELVETSDGDKWYKAKVNYITLDEKSGAEKKQAFFYLIQAKDIDHARNHSCNDTDEKMREVASHPAVSKAVKGFVDSIPQGHKVTISAPGCKDVVIDKTDDNGKDDAWTAACKGS